MSKLGYSNEKVIFGYGEATLEFSDDNRLALSFYKQELENLNLSHEKLKILDVGCGAGNKTKALRRFFPKWRFWGCDISKQAIKMARQKDSGISFLVADAQNLPIKSNGFDVVLMHSVLDHTRKPLKSAQEAFRVLKPGGTFLLMDPLEAEPTTIHGWLTRFKFFRQHRKNRCGHRHAFSKKSLNELLKKAGFVVEKVVYEWFYFSQLVDILYYPLLSLTEKGPEYTLKSYITTKKSKLSYLIAKLRAVVNILENIESLLTRNIPLGFLAYIKAKKNEK